MFGFLFGTTCLTALYFYFTHQHRGGHGRHTGRGFRRGLSGIKKRWISDRLYDRIDATPEQERVVAGLVSDVTEQWRSGEEARRTQRRALASLFRSEVLDPEQLDSWVAETRDSYEAILPTTSRAALSLHKSLEPFQRRRLADWLESQRPHSCGGD